MTETPEPCTPGNHTPIGFAGPYRGSMNDEYNTGPALDEAEWRYTCMNCGAVLNPEPEPDKPDTDREHSRRIRAT